MTPGIAPDILDQQATNAASTLGRQNIDVANASDSPIVYERVDAAPADADESLAGESASFIGIENPHIRKALARAVHGSQLFMGGSSCAA